MLDLLLHDLADPLLWIGVALGFLLAVALFTAFLMLLGLAEERESPAPPPALLTPGWRTRLSEAIAAWCARRFTRRTAANVLGFTGVAGFWALFFVVAVGAAS